MAEAVRNHEWALEVFTNCDYERTLLGKKGERAFRITPDAVAAKHFADLKSTENADPEAFSWACRKYSYHAQMAWYMDGLNLIRKDLEIARAFIIAVESKPPFPVTVMKLTDHALDLGRRQYSLWLERFLACEQSGQWPGYVQSVVDLDVAEDETELVFEGDTNVVDYPPESPGAS
jgi:PDDEXK-like domain of unknown function (DUF3799)